MNITIRKHPFSVRSRYEIETPSCIYFAQKKLFSLGGRIKLVAPRDRLLATIKGHFLSLHSKYEFELADSKTYHFECNKLWKGVFVCRNGEESFRLYRHKGLNYSIFSNDVQIAAFSKNRVVVGGCECYDVRMNDDANVIVVVCMVLAIGSSENEDDTATVTLDFGNIGPEERPFDPSWEPS